MNEHIEPTLWERYYLIVEGWMPTTCRGELASFTRAILILCKTDEYTPNERRAVWEHYLSRTHPRYRDFERVGIEWWRSL